MSKLGADPAALRQLATSIDQASESLDDEARSLGARIRSTGWDGPDARRYLAAWDSTYRPMLRTTAQTLSATAATLRKEAKQQEVASEASGGSTIAPIGTKSPFGTSYVDELGAVGASAVGAGLKVWKGFKTGTALVNAVKLGQLGSLSAGAGAVYRGAGGLVGATARQLGVADDFGIWSNLSKIGASAGTIGKIATGVGVVGGAFAIYGGFQQMFNTQYDGVRGGVDRVMGGLSVIGGAGSIAIALGGAALLGPVGVGVVVGAGVVAGAWALGNMVVDNWPAISSFFSDAGAAVGNALVGAGESLARAVAGPVGAVADLGKAAGDAIGKAGNFVKGLFG